MNLKLEKPVTEWCSKCDYTASRSRYLVSGKCPSCGDTSLHHGVKLPNQNLIGCYSYSGRFNLMSNDEQTQYIFTNLPKNVFGYTKKGFVVDDGDIDTSCPQNAAIELKQVIDRYLVNSNKKDIEMLVDYLNDDFMELYQEKKNENRIVELKSELYWLMESSGKQSD